MRISDQISEVCSSVLPEGIFHTGPIEHQMLVGFDATYSKEDQVATFESPDAVPLIDAFNPIYPAYTPPAFDDHKPTVRQRDMGIYLQDQLRYGNWIAVAGLRRDRSKNIVEGGQEIGRAHV